MSNIPKKHRKNNNEVKSLFALSPSGGRNLPLSELNGLEPMVHCALQKGEFITVSESSDMCVTSRGKVFADDSPDTIISGFDYYYEMVDYEEGEIQLTSETEALLPAPRSRSNIGVGEVVKINANVAVKWKLNNKLVSIVKKSSKELWIAAGDKGGICTINASYRKKGKTIQADISFMIVEPKGLQYKIGKYQDYPELERPNDSSQMIYHPQNGYNGAVGVRIKLLPASVNFSKVGVREVNCASVDTGYFAMNQIHCHIPNKPIINNLCTETGIVAHFDTIDNEPNIADAYDIAGGGDNNPTADIGQGGSMILDIPLQWCLLKPQDNPEIWKSLGTVHQEVILKANGDIQVSKGGFRYTLRKSEHYPDNHFIEAN